MRAEEQRWQWGPALRPDALLAARCGAYPQGSAPRDPARRRGLPGLCTGAFPFWLGLRLSGSVLWPRAVPDHP